jgi:hypothetical protein
VGRQQSFWLPVHVAVRKKERKKEEEKKNQSMPGQQPTV